MKLAPGAMPSHATAISDPWALMLVNGLKPSKLAPLAVKLTWSNVIRLFTAIIYEYL
jgi:hypothetical protein